MAGKTKAHEAEASPEVIMADHSTTDLRLTVHGGRVTERAPYLYQHPDRQGHLDHHGPHGLHVPRYPEAGLAVPVHPLAEAAAAAAAVWAMAEAVPAEAAAPADAADKCLLLNLISG